MVVQLWKAYHNCTKHLRAYNETALYFDISDSCLYVTKNNVDRAFEKK